MSLGNPSEEERPFQDDLDKDREDLPPIGHALRRARTAAGLSVDDVSNATRVRVAIVQAIEEDDFGPCGGDVYARGHIRTLARAVGLDPAPLIASYDKRHGGRPAPTPAAPLFEAERIRPERRGPNWTAAMVTAIVAVIGFVGFTAFGGDSDGTDRAQVAEGPEPSVSVTGKPTGKPAAPEPTESAIAAAPRDKVEVKVSAPDGRSWISAKDHNGRVLWDGVLEEGDSRTFQDDTRVDLVLGNAGALELHVNGEKIEDDFQNGQVERLSYTKGDPAAG
ncbi:helix-turn-helix domain-containing protein [Streptomyces sp. UH6]|uniref:helix-turn-helix domain-containing protein n=1 Tax=Streptomyces sp. UH6 TaxID=2748379 RepID=UPI0015D4824E|nr:RodZ domain-containing protein [Streptomyces sp. UH6]NYV76062.1 helix-turn-helix domain-containing protein [Streptomyces sp. UH6]